MTLKAGWIGPATALALLTACAGTALAQSDLSSWTSEKVTKPVDRAGNAKLLKSVPFDTGDTLRLPMPGEPAAAITTRAPPPPMPKLPSFPPKADTTIGKLPAGADPAYEAFDLGRYLTAYQLAKADAERGAPQAATLLGRLFQEGLGVAHNEVEAAKWYRQGAEGGDINAMFAFGVMLAEGGAIKKDKDGAALMFEKAALAGHVAANYNLALLFLAGEGKPENPQRAFAHMQYAAEAGLPVAQYDLAGMFANGVGTDNNIFQAARWLLKAADGGVRDAYLELGILLHAGYGIAKDEVRGTQMFRKAAEKGNVIAQNRLALCLANGLGVKADPIEATAWYVVSRGNGGFADADLEKVAAKLPKADRLRAEAEAQRWLDRSLLLVQ